jgi:hypothetical protein
MSFIALVSDRITSKCLSPLQAFGFFLAALSVYSLPLLLNNYPYFDDNLRSLVAATVWHEEGRVFGDYLLHALTFTGAAPDVFPLTLLAGMVIMAYALCRLASHWFANPTLAQCAIVLPLWYNPFYLQILSYQYDQFTVSVGIALVACAVAFTHRNGLLNWGMAALLVTAGVSTHQVVLNVFLGLACVDVLVQANRQPGGRLALRAAVHHLNVLAGAGVLYYLTSYQAISRDRGGLIWPSLDEWYVRAGLLASKVLLFITPANLALFVFLAGSALVGWLLIAWRARQGKASLGWQCLHVSLCVLAVVGLIGSVGGMMFLVYDLKINLGARVLMGVGPLLVGLLFLAYAGWVRIYKRSAVLVFLPLLCFLSFAFAYGQVMKDKKDLEGFTRTLLATDLLNEPRLQAAREIVVFTYESNGPVFSPVCAQAALPALEYIFWNAYLMHPAQLVKWGVRNVRLQSRYDVPALGEPIFTRPFYHVYSVDNVAYVRFRPAATQLECRYP